MSARDDALVEVVDLITRHGLTVQEVTSALDGSRAFTAARSGSILQRLFAYIGGIFVFAGLGIYIGMRWDDLSAAGRVMVTLGPGICVFVLALVCASDARLERAAAPLFLVAAVVQPTGILVMLREYASGGEPAHGLLMMNAVMAIQQGSTFWARRRTELALTTIVFVLGFFAVGFDLVYVPRDLIGVVMGVSLLCVGWSLDRSVHRSIAGLVFSAGAATLLAASYDWLEETPAEVLFIGLACGIIFLATVARSRSLLVVGTVALIAYIGKFMADHFANSLNAPLILALVGFVLIGVGALAVSIHSRYIAGRP